MTGGAMPDLPATVTVHATVAGVELHVDAGRAGDPLVVRLDRDTGLTLADEVTLACEGRLTVVAA